MLEVIAIDADDTLWHSEIHYLESLHTFQELLKGQAEPALVETVLNRNEKKNIQYYGYGIKSYALSMIETAVEVTGSQVTGEQIQQVINLTKTMLSAPVELMDHVASAIPVLAASLPLMLVTKGDLFDQQTKLEKSSLKKYFQYVEIVSEKDDSAYRKIIARYHIDPQRLLMVGNSIRSDILPVLELGGSAVYIPYSITWSHEQAPLPENATGRFFQLEHIGLLPELVAQINSGGLV